MVRAVTMVGFAAGGKEALFYPPLYPSFGVVITSSPVVLPFPLSPRRRDHRARGLSPFDKRVGGSHKRPPYVVPGRESHVKYSLNT